METRYTLERTEAEMAVKELLADYYNVEYFESLCRKCPNYGSLWSCPPYDFDPRGCLEKYERLQLVGTKILLNAQLREEVITKEGLAEVTEDIIAGVKAEVDKELLGWEKERQSGRMLTSGGCRLCTRCARTSGMPCRQKGRMRYSLESLGCDVTKLTGEKLGIQLLWADGRLPEYFVLVNGYLIP